MSGSKASTALLNRIAEITRAYYGSEQHYLSTASFASPVTDAHIDLLGELASDRMTDSEEVQTLFEISQLVDCIQDGSSEFMGPVQNPDKLSDTFVAVTDNIEFATAGLDDSLKTAYAHALSVLFQNASAGDLVFFKTEPYAAFCVLRSDIAKSELAATELRRQLAEISDGAEREAMQVDIDDKQASIAQQRQLLQASDTEHGFTDAEQVRQRAEQALAALPASTASALANLDLTRMTDVITETEFLRADFFPSHIAEDHWVPIRLERQDIQNASADSPLEHGAGASDQIGTLDDADIDAIELDVQMLSVHRPWFWDGLFDNRLWRWKTASDPVSSGPDNPGGRIPAYVAGLVLARNLRVHGKASANTPSTPAIRIGNILSQSITARPDFVKTLNLKAGAFLLTPKAQASATGLAPMVLNRPHVMLPMSAAVPGRRGAAETSRAAPLAVRPLREQLVINPQLAVMRPPSRRGPVDGTLVDERGQAVVGALIQLTDAEGKPAQSTKSGRGGRFRLDAVLRGKYTLTVTKKGYAQFSQSIGAPTRKPLALTVKSTANATAILTVKLISGTPEEASPFSGNASLRVRGVGTSVNRLEKFIDASSLQLTLAPGTYELVLSSADAASIEKPHRKLTISGDTQVDFRLESSLLVRNPDMYLIGFACVKVPNSPDPDASVFGD